MNSLSHLHKNFTGKSKQCCLFLLYPTVFPPNAWNCHEVKQYHVCCLHFSQGSKNPAQAGSRNGRDFDVGQHGWSSSTRHWFGHWYSLYDNYQQDIMLEMVTCTRDSSSGLETRNWLEIHSLVLKNLSLNHASGKETTSLLSPPSTQSFCPSRGSWENGVTRFTFPGLFWFLISIGSSNV